jgi:hypothetical protein
MTALFIVAGLLAYFKFASLVGQALKDPENCKP